MTKSEHDAVLQQELQQFRVPQSVTDAAIRLYLESLDCGQARLIYKLYKDGSDSAHRAIAGMRCNPADFDTREEFESAYLATEFLRKYKDLKTGTDTEAVAMASLRETEGVCYATNMKFLDLAASGEFSGANVWLLQRATSVIAKTLGPFEVDKVLELCAWGPGATFATRGENTSSSIKFQHEVGISKSCYRLWHRVLKAAYPTWWGHLIDAGYPDFQEGNRVITVPKDAEKDRTITSEPGLNSFFQKGIGSLMVLRLRGWGCDLRDQTLNQRLAREGSVTNKIATVDLRNASNTIAYWPVNALLSESGDWFEVLDATRSHFGLIDGLQYVEWEMFSSMGNGFTFPLQTVIFLAAARSVCEYLQLPTDKVVVYGDDILLPVEAVSLFVSFCDFLGFSVNTKKTHASGWFRESCGSHWWDGVDVKPIYLKERLSNVNSVFKLANAIRRLAHRRAACGCDLRLKRPWLLLYNCVPKKFRFTISEGYGDGGFVGNIDEANPSYKRTKATPYTRMSMVEGCHVRQVVEIGVNADGFEHMGQMLAALARVKATQTITFYVKDLRQSFRVFPYYSKCSGWPLPVIRTETFAFHHGDIAEDMPAMGNSAPLRRVTESKINWILLHAWYDLGPWI